MCEIPFSNLLKLKLTSSSLKKKEEEEEGIPTPFV